MNKISIIIPVYRAEKYLKKCLDSIMAQTYTNWECILVDDGSPDKSGAICEDYSEFDSRFKVFHKTNGGPSTARNYGLDHADGDFVCFVDSDDYIAPLFLEHIVAPMLTNDTIKMTVIGMRLYGKEEGIFPLKAFNKIMSNLSVFEHLLRGDIIKGWLCNKCFRNALIGDTRLNVQLHYCEDLDILLRLMFYSPDFCVQFVEWYDYYYYIKDDGISLSHNIRNKVMMIDEFNKTLAVYPDSRSKRIRLIKGAFTQCRSLVNLDSINEKDNAVIKKAKHIFIKYFWEVFTSFDRRQAIQIVIILVSYKLYKRIIDRG